MSDNQAYALLSTGKVVDGFDQDQVVQSFAGLFKCSDAKALVYATSEKVIRKDIDKATGEKYSQQLRGIGLDVQLIARNAPEQEAAAANSELSLTPTETTPSASTHTPPISTATVDRDPRNRSEASDDIDDRDDDSPFLKAIIGPVVGAFIGALIWAMVMNFLDRELGIIALAVGGIVGYCASITRFNGSTAAVICALLVVVSIFSGKFIGYNWIMSGYDDYDTYVDESVMAEAEEWGEVYKAESVMLQEFSHTDSNISEFMVNNDYSYTSAPAQEEIDDFKQYTIPMIMAYENYSAANPKPTLQKLHKLWVQDSQGLSVMDAVKSGLGLLDLLFLFFGVATAFRMVNEADD